MGTIIKRKNHDGTITYRVQVRRKGAPTLSATFPTYKKAEEWEIVTEAVMRAKRHFPYVGARKPRGRSPVMVTKTSIPRCNQ